MSFLLETLYRFALEQRCTVREPEYQETCRYAGLREDRLRAGLTAEQSALLDELLADLSLKTYWEQVALFRCALALGLELGRL